MNDSGKKKESFYIPVTIKQGEGVDQNVKVWLTVPPHAKDIVHICIPGSTYKHDYWDFPYKPEKYSYAEALVYARISTLNLDRLGSGKSSLPPGKDVTVEVQSYVVHQLVQKLRSGKIGNKEFKKVVLVGHSLGSGVAIEESTTYNDVDGLILTGLLHTESFKGPYWKEVIKTIYSATKDPELAYEVPADTNYGILDYPFRLIRYVLGKMFSIDSSLILNKGYFVTRPGTRGIFHNLDRVETRVVETDEETKSIVAWGESNPLPVLKKTPNIKVPVLCVVGGLDTVYTTPPNVLNYNNVLKEEGKYYSPEAELEVFILPKAGHAINLDPDAHQWFQEAIEWIQRKVGMG